MKPHRRFYWIVPLLALAAANAYAQPPAAEQKPAAAATPPATGADLFGFGGAAKAASDLRLAGEAFDRVAQLLRDLLPPAANALAEMSRGFDPFGYKAAFQTIASQNEIIQKQQQTIEELLRGEIARLEQELQRAKSSAPSAKAAKAKKQADKIEP
jgi:hypothetical protein